MTEDTDGFFQTYTCGFFRKKKISVRKVVEQRGGRKTLLPLELWSIPATCAEPSRQGGKARVPGT